MYCISIPRRDKYSYKEQVFLEGISIPTRNKSA